jgi:hypothetical protein
MQPHAYFPNHFQAPQRQAPQRPYRADNSSRDAERRIRELTKPTAASTMVATFAGALTGVATGFVAGPLGGAIGGVLGAITGALSGLAMELIDATTSSHDARLDRDIGVTGGDLSAWRTLHPATASPTPQMGLYSAASAGLRAELGTRAAASGPFTSPA